jgi:hypothetical protein
MRKYDFKNLVVEDLDPLEDVVLDEAVKDGPVDLPEELAGVELVLGDDDEAVVVQDVALHRVVLTRDLVPALQATHLRSCSQKKCPSKIFCDTEYQAFLQNFHFFISDYTYCRMRKERDKIMYYKHSNIIV